MIDKKYPFDTYITPPPVRRRCTRASLRVVYLALSLYALLALYIVL